MTTAQKSLAFLVERPEAFNHYLPVWRHLEPSGYDVLVSGERMLRDETIEAGRALGLPMRDAEEVLVQGEIYRHLVSHHPIEFDEPLLITRLGERNVRFMYTLGKAGWTFSEWNTRYDLILCYGPFQAAALRELYPDLLVLQMGYPRFDSYFTTEWDDVALARQYDCDPDRPTVAWLPTWGALSSVHLFADAVAALRPDFNVIIKLHPLQSANEPDTVRLLQGMGFNCLVTDERDNVPLFRLADYVLCDYGGSLFGALLTDKRVLLLDVPGAENDPTMGSESPELQLREHLVHISDSEAVALPALLANRELWELQAAVRGPLINEFVAPLRGCAGATAAHFLRNLDGILWGLPTRPG